MAEPVVAQPLAGGAEAAGQGEEPPLWVEDGGLRWVRTEMARGADFVDGTAWIAEFRRRLSASQEAGPSGPPGRRRLLRQVATDGDCPQFWGSSGDAALPLRNEVLRQMGPEEGPGWGAGRKVRLATGEEVIFWFNVGPPGPPRARVYVTEARCPHQQVCLNSGELKDVEDLAGARRAMIRCPRHNKTFDLRTGESPGNSETLRVFPCRFEHGRWYVAVGPSAEPCPGVRGIGDAEVGDVDVEMEAGEEPSPKRPCPESDRALACGLLSHLARPLVSRASVA